MLININYTKCSQSTVNLKDCKGILVSSFIIITVHALSGHVTYEKVGGGLSDTALCICFEARMCCEIGYFTRRH